MIDTPAQDLDLISKMHRLLDEQGIVALLRLLNARTPHRFTGIYRFDPPSLRNMYLVDAFDPQTRKGDDVAMADAYCVIVGERRRSIVFDDARCDPRFTVRNNSPVVSYCGTLLVTSDGRPFGSLCHYDIRRCEENVNDVAMLEAVGAAVMARIEADDPEATRTTPVSL